MKRTYYFSKTEYNEELDFSTEYRIYLYECDGWPLVLRNALDEVCGIHSELVSSLNDATDQLKAHLHDADGIFGGLTLEQRGEILSTAARSAIVYSLEGAGWSIHFAE